MPVPNISTSVESKMKSKMGISGQKLGVQQMVHWFVASSYASGSFTEERVKNSVELLHCVPAARYAVLHRFTILFEEAIRAHLDLIEYQASAPGISPEVSCSLELVVTTLLELLSQNGEAWAPILCKWSVESLGQISSCYKQRQIVPLPTNLPRLLSFWLNSMPMRMLLDVYRTCLKILIEHSPESCVDSLLTASSNHSPYFDWVVADVGNAFPDAIIERVLQSGFQKFSKLRWTSLGMSSSSAITLNENERSILTSVIRILEHLITHHEHLICSKMLELFKFPADKTTGQIKAALFLMTLFSMSSQLLWASTHVFVKEIDANVLNTLYKQFQKAARTADELENLCSLVVHLTCQSGAGSYKLMNLIISAASKNPTADMQNLDSSVRDVFAKILPSLLKDLHRLALNKGFEEANQTKNALTELSENYQNLCDQIITTSSTERRSWLHSLLLSVCLHNRARQVLSYLLIQSLSASHLQIFLSLFDEIQPLVPELLENTVHQSFSMIKTISNEKRVNFFSNIYHLASQTGSGLVSENFMNRLKKSLCSCIDELMKVLGSFSSSTELSSITIQLIFMLLSSVSSSKLRLSTRLLPLTRTLVFFFFKLLHTSHVNNDQSMQSCHRALVELTQTHEMFEVVCRIILEASVTKDNSILFGRRIEPDFNEELHSSGEQQVSLLSVHRKLSMQAISRRTVDGFVPISVETGLIGTGPKRKKKCPISKAAQMSNNECLSLLIYRCCCKTSGGADITQITIPDVTHAFDIDKLSLLSDCILSSITSASPYLATTVTLDGDAEWPPCHMRKFTIERDLKMFHFLDEHPFVWQMLFLVAHNYRAIWSLSPILRSCISVLLSHFESSRFNAPPPEHSLHYQFAVKVVQIASKGQLLPVPLSYISELFNCVSEYEVCVLLTVVWNFIKDHPPRLDMELKNQRDFSSEKINLQPYLATVHTVLHANIVKLGYLFSWFVIS